MKFSITPCLLIMGLFTKESQEKKKVESIGIYAPQALSNSSTTKGEIEQSSSHSLFKDLGQEHLFNLNISEGLYCKFGFVTGAVDKIVNFVWGPGFFTKSDDIKAKTIIDTWIQDVDFNYYGKQWFRQALIKGFSPLELGGKTDETVKGVKLLNSNSMYVIRNNKGIIEGWNQYNGSSAVLEKNKVIAFKPFQIANLNINVVGSNAYGYGLIYPALSIIDNFLKADKDMHMLLTRKANSPIHAKIGNVEKDMMPTADAVSDFGKKMEYLNNKHEWATDALVEMKVLDFGNISDKFVGILNHDLDLLFASFQVPEVLMGRGSIPEGLAAVQMDAFQRLVVSYQEDIEKVIEREIFKRVLEANGLASHVEFEWGQPSNSEKNERVTKLTTLLQNPMLSDALRTEIEKDIAQNLGYGAKALESSAQEKRREDMQSQPKVPEQNETKQHTHTHIIEEMSEDELKQLDNEVDYELKAWLNFNYKDYLDYILNITRADPFLNLVNRNQGALNETQIAKLKDVLYNGFKEGKSIVKIKKEILEKVRPPDLYRELSDGTQIKMLDSNRRSYLIARTETTRLANLGSKEMYKDNGIEKYKWIAAASDRTCPVCMELNGRIYEMSSKEMPPAHINCRCTTGAVVKLI